MKKLVLAGSHAATTAISVVEELKKRKLDLEIHFIGKKYASEGSKTFSLEFNSLPHYGVKFHNLESGKIQTKFTRHTIPALFKIPFGFFQSFFILKRINPDLVLSFGGAAGALVSFWAWVLKIPVILHEQTSTAGRANKFSSKFAKKIAVSRESSYKYFPKEKTVLTGNPINKEIVKLSFAKRRDEVKTILITGGSRGSTWINNAVKPILPRLLQKYFVIHQTGEADFDNFKDIKSERYLRIPQAGPNEWVKILEKSDLVVSRAGANTVSELIALKKPSILIPIYWSYLNEQNENALYMQSLGLATIIHQKQLGPERLLDEIVKMISNYMRIIRDTRRVVSKDLTASENLVDLLEENL